MSQTLAGAYGVRFCGLKSGRWLGVTEAAHWPQISCRSDLPADGPELELHSDPFELRIRADIAHSELVHPLLGRVASHLALAGGADGMHAGAIAGAGGAWAVIGPKMAGKSTLLAALSVAGTPIVTDDVLVFTSGVAMAGPRCIDLRPDVQLLGLGVAVRPEDPRHRISLPPIPGEHPLAGVIHLEWSETDPTIERLDPREAVRRLLTAQREKGYPRDPLTLLDLAALPTLLLRRPRSINGLDASMALIQGIVEEQMGLPDERPRHLSARR